MIKKQKLIVGIGLAVICGVVLRTAFSKSAKPDGIADSPLTAGVAQNNAPEEQQQAQTPAEPATADTAADSDGKTVIPDGKETVGKETIGKEALPPVGESIGVRAEMVSLLSPSAPPEYLGKPNANNNALLTPPNPVNVSGPVVSAETR